MSTNTKQSAKNNPIKKSSSASHLDNKVNQFAGVKWGPWTAIIIVVITYFVAEVVAFNLASIYPLARHWTKEHSKMWLSSSTVGNFVYVLLAEAITVAMILGFIQLVKAKRSAIGLKRLKLDDVAYAFIGVVVYFVIYLLAVAILSKFVPSLKVNQSQAIGFSSSTKGWSLIIVLFSLVILPPIAEEIMFRGFLYSGLRKRLPFIWGVLITSLLFAGPHLLESAGGGLLWIAGVDTFTLSLVLCFLREKTGRLYAGIGVHGLKNFIAFAALFLLHAH